jgi:protein-S-isoprenylcysteine O-methyltransferase Ste14
MTHVLRLVDISVLFVWLAVDLVVVFSRHSKGAKRSDRFSLLGVMISVWCGIYLALALRSAVGVGTFEAPVQIVGLVLLAVGIAMRSIAIAQLGAFHTPDVAVQAGHHVVDTGLYRRVRHPSYLGASIALLGFGLGLGSFPSAAAVVGCALIGYAYRIHVEERALLELLGGDYAAYCRRTYRLIPGVY